MFAYQRPRSLDVRSPVRPSIHPSIPHHLNYAAAASAVAAVEGAQRARENSRSFAAPPPKLKPGFRGIFERRTDQIPATSGGGERACVRPAGGALTAAVIIVVAVVVRARLHPGRRQRVTPRGRAAVAGSIPVSAVSSRLMTVGHFFSPPPPLQQRPSPVPAARRSTCHYFSVYRYARFPAGSVRIRRRRVALLVGGTRWGMTWDAIGDGVQANVVIGIDAVHHRRNFKFCGFPYRRQYVGPMAPSFQAKPSVKLNSK